MLSLVVGNLSLAGHQACNTLGEALHQTVLFNFLLIYKDYLEVSCLLKYSHHSVYTIISSFTCFTCLVSLSTVFSLQYKSPLTRRNYMKTMEPLMGPYIQKPKDKDHCG